MKSHSNNVEREKAIGARIRQYREHLQWPQIAIAKEIGISRDKLASIECGRTPLRYDIAQRLCDRFMLNEVWLAGKATNPQATIPFGDNVRAAIPPRMRFSRAFDEFLWPSLNAVTRELAERLGAVGVPMRFPPAGLPGVLARDWTLVEDVTATIKCIPAERRDEFRIAVLGVVADFVKKYSPQGSVGAVSNESDRSAKRAAESKENKTALDSYSLKGNPSDVKSELDKLITRVKRLASKPGAKAELARLLDVAPARITEWLSDEPKSRKEPGGHYALELLKWVELQERKP